MASNFNKTALTDDNGNYAAFKDTLGATTIPVNLNGAIPVTIVPSVPSSGTFKSFAAPAAGVALSNAAITTTSLGYTPAAGKIFYLTDLYLAITETGATQATRIVSVQSATGPITLFSGLVGDKSGANTSVQMAGMDTGPQFTNAGGNIQIVWPQLGAGDAGVGMYYVAGMEV